ncbi:hypothetical protein Taro_025624 [Colocasia esculenta]|uniref:Uncharacterized protein n=1 Tax=Colocasia esculenta TaxID=4460 RepID=A0A843VCS0_COLES|nr:hypothetical protein [Colocasia esculenta]
MPVLHYTNLTEDPYLVLEILVKCRVVVVLGGRGVDSNLRILQVPKGGWTIVERVALPNCARKRRGVVQFPWELAEGSA